MISELDYSEVDGYQLNIINATNRKKTNAKYITTNRRYTLFEDKLINFNPNQIYYTKTKVGKINKDTDKFLCVITELFNYKNEWKWIIRDSISKDNNSSNNQEGIFNFSYINQSDNSKTHRHGWQYVYENIK